MRSLIYLIVIAAAGYLGYTVGYPYYLEKYGGKKAEGDAPAAETTARSASGERDPAPSAPPEPEFKSKIPIPDASPGKHLAKPGVYYVLQRASIEHSTGIAAVVPGEEVRLMNRKGNGKVTVTNGKFEFEMKEAQLTNDLDLAREAERIEARLHPPKRR